MEDKISEAPIAIMDGIVSKDFDSKPRNLIFSWEKFRKIFQKHGEFFPENLLETVNNPSVVIKNVKYRGEHIKEKINILKTIP
ncbi:MAG: hypothetical protein LBG59_02375 [Candidatus Peribacteria bacterium]|jgi:hypothetical protein|nr:hypothetical protein [Candidatus Peribacteria bacterium]